MNPKHLRFPRRQTAVRDRLSLAELERQGTVRFGATWGTMRHVIDATATRYGLDARKHAEPLAAITTSVLNVWQGAVQDAATKAKVVSNEGPGG